MNENDLLVPCQEIKKKQNINLPTIYIGPKSGNCELFVYM